MLRNAGIITVVFTGIATEFRIESSARDAFNRGFYSVVSQIVCLRQIKRDITNHLKI